MASVTGTAALRALLLKLTPAVSAALQTTIEDQGNQLADLQRSRVKSKSGNTKQSIRVTPLSKGKIGVVVRAGGQLTTKPVKKGKSPTYDYAAAQELGTQKMLAQPFFYPSYRQMKPKIMRAITSSVNAAVATIK